MNRRIRYDPDRKRGSGAGCGGFMAILSWLLVLAAGAAFIFMLNARPAVLAGLIGGTANPLAPAVVTVTLAPAVLPTSAASATPEPLPTETLDLAETADHRHDEPLPTSTLLPEPSPSPTALVAPAPTQFYTTQSGDTLVALASRFGVNPADIVAPEGLRGSTTLAHGQLLVIPNVLTDLGPAGRLIPDSEMVFSGAAAGFDPQAFAADRNGYLARYQGNVDGRNASGGDVLLAASRNHSVNPRLLMSLLEYQSGWVSNPQPSGDALNFPFGYEHAYLRNLNAQLTWVTSQLAVGYYGWRAGSLTELTFPDGTTLRLHPAQNAGTVALQYFFSLTRNRPDWDDAIGPTGFLATYQGMFGDPFARALDPLLPQDLTQISLALPFAPGQTWYFSGGPHGAWETGGAQAALDFAPPAVVGGCAESPLWVTAVAAGLVLRSSNGVVIIDLDGDGRETTGWNILYMHIANEDRVPLGTFVERGDRIGHPSCEGGRSTGTHLHIARKYNGEWILAAGVIPFNLGGWVAGQGKGEYYGTLTRDGVTVEACSCTAAWTAITAFR